MIQTFMRNRYILLSLTLGLLLTVFLVGCTASLGPVMSYQGRLTDASGTPLNGNFDFTFRLYTDDTAGTSIYTETQNIAVVNGLFDTSVGPTTILASMDPAKLAQPLWLEVTIGTETLTPRQRLLGSPYAFTLMPGAVISSTFNGTLPGPLSEAIVTIINNDDTTDSHPALQLVGNVALELVDADGAIASIVSPDYIHIRSDNNILLYLDDDNNAGNERFYVYGRPTTEYCYFDGTAGTWNCTGAKVSIATVNGEERAMYAVESPEVISEDFGSGKLVDGQATVTIDALFAATVNLSEYQIFVTPLGDCNGLYVSNKTATSFEVHELGGGDADIEFDYRIVAKRLGYEDVRMEILTPAEGQGEEK